ncbi:sulfurtransferase [Oculatella sp. LEGE 06141]|uniref:sulfurtransferase n=1 Tax=Oculatella sp. LEGE 06141 TaxID=1828648 RepID=UPI0018829343|nr:sulfurtransferase [Oculatella sp. LEGE 06141]MBE9178976.1 sulfurtransferase [Oculatella sp. LEGE 06141]
MTLLTSIVSAEWLVQHLSDPQVAIADCRFALADPTSGRQQYEAAHIPGAYYFDLNRDLSSPVAPHGGRHPLPDPPTLAAKLAACGISNTAATPKVVVAYDDSRLAFAARFWWLLRYMGYDHVAVLDGGFSAWQTAGYPVTSAIPQPQSGEFVPQVRSDWVVDIKTVKDRKDLPNVALVDSREAERYRGEREPIDPIAGHIPGAANYPWMDVTDAQGYIRPPLEQQHRWSALEQSGEVLVYCGSGVTACVNLLSLELAGISVGKLYAGSWSDWCSYL